MSKNKKREWRIDKYDGAVVVDQADNDICCCSMPSKAVKKMDYRQYVYDNAKLIAAAPELLEACKNAFLSLAPLVDPESDKQVEAVNSLAGVIAKAELILTF